MSDNVILLGNSLNLLEESGESWDNIVEACEYSLDNTGMDPKTPQKRKKEIPLIFRMSYLFNSWQTNNDKDGRTVFSDFCSKLCRLRPNAMHTKLVKAVEGCNILTTNYDYAIECALGPTECDLGKLTPKTLEDDFEDLMHMREFGILSNLTRHHGRVWHIHGEAKEPESIIIDHDSYVKGLSALKIHGYHKGSWLSIFLKSSVHIMGLELRYTESLLWHALQSRLEIPAEERKSVFYYHFVCKNDKQAVISADNLENMLATYKVNYKRIEVKKDRRGKLNYRRAWRDAIEKLKENMAKPSELPTSYPTSKVVSSSCPTSRNPKRCWMNIGVNKLKNCADDDTWFFDCNVRGERRFFYTTAKELKDKFRIHGINVLRKGTPRYSFYVDYSDGKLYKSNNSKEVILSLAKIEDRECYKNFKTHKQN